MWRSHFEWRRVQFNSIAKGSLYEDNIPNLYHPVVSDDIKTLNLWICETQQTLFLLYIYIIYIYIYIYIYNIYIYIIYFAGLLRRFRLGSCDRQHSPTPARLGCGLRLLVFIQGKSEHVVRIKPPPWVEDVRYFTLHIVIRMSTLIPWWTKNRFYYNYYGIYYKFPTCSHELIALSSLEFFHFFPSRCVSTGNAKKLETHEIHELIIFREPVNRGPTAQEIFISRLHRYFNMRG